MITQTRLKELLDYNPDTGIFVWKVARQGIRIGAVAGHLHKKPGGCAVVATLIAVWIDA